MMSAHRLEKVVAAPEALGLETRGGFRRAASQSLEELPQGSGRLVIDLTATRAVDSAGLGANEELRLLLVLTNLDDLFELEAGRD
jgi:hypothetical protein